MLLIKSQQLFSGAGSIICFFIYIGRNTESLKIYTKQLTFWPICYKLVTDKRKGQCSMTTQQRRKRKRTSISLSILMLAILAVFAIFIYYIGFTAGQSKAYNLKEEKQTKEVSIAEQYIEQKCNKAE
jgi:cell division protein FtsL